MFYIVEWLIHTCMYWRDVGAVDYLFAGLGLEIESKLEADDHLMMPIPTGTVDLQHFYVWIDELLHRRCKSIIEISALNAFSRGVRLVAALT